MTIEGHFASMKTLEINPFVQLINLHDSWLTKSILKGKAYELKQFFPLCNSLTTMMTNVTLNFSGGSSLIFSIFFIKPILFLSTILLTSINLSSVSLLISLTAYHVNELYILLKIAKVHVHGNTTQLFPIKILMNFNYIVETF